MNRKQLHARIFRAWTDMGEVMTAAFIDEAIAIVTGEADAVPETTIEMIETEKPLLTQGAGRTLLDCTCGGKPFKKVCMYGFDLRHCFKCDNCGFTAGLLYEGVEIPWLLVEEAEEAWNRKTVERLNERAR